MNKSNSILTLLILILCSFQIYSVTVITPATMGVILSTIDSLFFVNPTRGIEIRKFVRAAFHDCMGGCDGSFNLTNSANRGLQKYTTIMNATFTALNNARQNPSSYATFNNVNMSRADFFMLCEQRALAYGIKNDPVNAGNPSFAPTISTPNGYTFYYGRLSNDPVDADTYEGTLPQGADSWQSMLSDISTGLNNTINEADVVALLGTHGAGVANFNNSGFNGPWGPRTDINIINNHFFINLLGYNFPGNSFTQITSLSSYLNEPVPPSPNDGGFLSAPPPTTSFQWNRIRTGPPNLPNSGAKMMLPIDMQIYLNFTPNGTDGGSTVDGYCPQANNQTSNLSYIFDCSTLSSPSKQYLGLRPNTAALALKYAQNNTQFITDLIASFLKMSSYAPTTPILNAYKADYVCIGGKWTCTGNIFFESCGTPPSPLSC